MLPAFADEREGLPFWVQQPKGDDSVYMYRVGHATGLPTREAAIEAAHADTLRRFTLSLLTESVGQDARTRRVPLIKFRNVELVQGCEFARQSVAGWDAWVQVSWPFAEKPFAAEQIGAIAKLESEWEKARADVAAGKLKEAQTALESLVPAGESPDTSFSADEVRLALGDTHARLNSPVEARRHYEAVVATGRNEGVKAQAREKIAALPPPPRFWPMGERFGGGKVGLVCGIREGADWAPFAELTRLLAQECRDGGLAVANVARALGAALPDVCDAIDPDAAVAAAKAENATVILQVCAQIDKEKRAAAKAGAKRLTLGIDTVVSFAVLDTRTGRTVYGGSFKEVAGTATDATLAERITAILVTRYLLPHCPAIVAGDR